MLKLYGFDTINTLKVLIFLFETDSPFEYIPINIRAGAQHSPEFRAINPAGKLPVILDGANTQTESNAILFNLAQKTGWGLGSADATSEKLLSWLFYQASTQGPHFGQIEYWTHFSKTPNPAALQQHRAIAQRSIAYLDNMLKDADYFCTKTYSIADIALFPWLHIHDRLGVSLEKETHLSAWLNRMRNRQAVSKACAFFEGSTVFTMPRLDP